MSNLTYHILLSTAIFIGFLGCNLYISGKQQHRLSQQLISGTFGPGFIQGQIPGMLILGISLLIPTPYLTINEITAIPQFTQGLLLTWIMLIIASAGTGLISAKKILRINTQELPAYDPEHAWSYLLTRIVFLGIYEVFFRGILLLGTLQFTNLFNALLINLLLYFLVHIRDSKAELIGTIPFGLALCLITGYSLSVWPAIVLHLVLSLTHEGYLLYHLTLKPIKK